MGNSREKKKTQFEEQETTFRPSTSVVKTVSKKNAKFSPFNLVNVKEYTIMMEIIKMLSKEPVPVITKRTEGKYKINVTKMTSELCLTSLKRKV